MKKLIEKILNKWGYFKVSPTKPEMIIKSSVSEINPIRIIDEFEIDEFEYYSYPLEQQREITKELTGRILKSASKFIEYKAEIERVRGKVKMKAELYVYDKVKNH